ncbi:GSCOCG00013173001-RA-CDS [Cotesia congregata]|nr:GSCOCG00013173001-RA-CDS [Cotesia congregata]
MKRLYDNKEFSDMVIKIRDDEFPAHKILISALSHVFHTMLTTDMKESKENSITFSDTTDTDVIKELLLFVYKGKMDKAETDAELALKLCNFAHMYQINKLKTTCEYILIKSLTNENASTILTEGKLMESVILQQHAIAYIKLHDSGHAGGFNRIIYGYIKINSFNFYMKVNFT